MFGTEEIREASAFPCLLLLGQRVLFLYVAHCSHHNQERASCSWFILNLQTTDIIFQQPLVSTINHERWEEVHCISAIKLLPGSTSSSKGCFLRRCRPSSPTNLTWCVSTASCGTQRPSQAEWTQTLGVLFPALQPPLCIAALSGASSVSSAALLPSSPSEQRERPPF